MEEIVRILEIENVTHDVKRFRIVKPEGYHFNAGQATEVSINKPGWEDERRPFTFTALNEKPYLEFTIKIYPEHNGVTGQLNNLTHNDELIIRDVWGAIEYKGPGYFIAGGAGITPFIAILRQLQKDNKVDGNELFFSNKTSADIILKDELNSILKEKALFVVTDEPGSQYINGFIDEAFLKEHIKDLKKNFYLCGPPKMIEAMSAILEKMGVTPESVVFEK
jgi:ferredoxin-NADP reductase